MYRVGTISMGLRTFLAVIAAGVSIAEAASASVTLYNDQASFQGAFTGSYTLVNLDAAPFSAFASGYRLDDAGPAASLLGLGIDSVGLNAQVAAGQDYQTPTARDRLILNGAFFGGEIVFNFTGLVNGVGGWANNGDGGHVQAYSGLNGTGVLLGSAGFGPGSFGGLIASDAIKSVRFTCEFNFDLACGVYDVQFGNLAGGVPEPATWAMMILGFGAAGLMIRRRKAVIA